MITHEGTTIKQNSMLQYDKTKGVYLLPAEEAERIMQVGIAAQLCSQLLSEYGDTPQVREIIGDCMRNGWPRAMFENDKNRRF